LPAKAPLGQHISRIQVGDVPERGIAVACSQKLLLLDQSLQPVGADPPQLAGLIESVELCERALYRRFEL
jgi:hypothetical protein